MRANALARVATGLGITATLVGLAGLLNRLVAAENWQIFGLETIPMKPSSGIAVAALGVAIAVQSFRPAKWGGPAAVVLGAGLGAAVGIVTIILDVIDTPDFIDGWFAIHPSGTPARMSIASAFSLILAAAAVFAARSQQSRGPAIVQALGMAVIGVGCVGIAAIALDLPAFTADDLFESMSAVTAVALVLLGLGLLFLRADGGLISLLHANSAHRRSALHIGLSLVVLMAGLVWLTWNDDSDHTGDVAVSMTLTVVASISLMTAVVAWAINTVVTAETTRNSAEQQLKALNESLESRVAQRTADLQELAMQVSESEQRERQRIARVLHDHLQQFLVAAKLQLSIRQPESRDLPAARADTLEALMGDALAASRTLAVELAPPLLSTEGLAAAVDWLIGQMQTTHHLRAEVARDPADPAEWRRLHAVTADFMFQAMRELLFNAVKHGTTPEVTLRMRLDEGEMATIEVANPAPPRAETDAAAVSPAIPTGFGLAAIAQRAEFLGGRANVRRLPGDVFHVAIAVPARLDPVARSSA